MKRILAVLLAMVLVLALFAGCKKAESTESAAAETEIAESTTEASAEAEPAEDSTAADNESQADDAAEAVSAAVISYPLEGSPEVTFWTSIRTPHGAFIPSMEWNDMLCMPAIREQTGVDLQITSINDTTASEQYNLMVASGDWPSYSMVSSYYTGGLAQAYEDEVIVELADDMLAENAPDYYTVLSALSDQDKAYTLTNGVQMAVYTIADGVTQDQGLVTRLDWYEELGSPELNTLDAITQYLYDVMEKYDTEYTLDLESGADFSALNDAFGTYIASYEASTLSVYVVDGQVVTPFTQDEYRSYVEWINGLYNDGIIYQDFYSLSDETGHVRFKDIANDDVALWVDSADSLNTPNMHRSAEMEPLVMKPLGIVTDGDGVNNFGSYRSIVGNNYSIYSDADVETVLQFFNYFYTEDGSILANYGIPAESYDDDSGTYYINENGDCCYTTLIIDNLTGTMPSNALDAYVGSHFPCYSLSQKMFSTYADSKLEAIELWSNQVNSFENEYPTGAGLTSEEQDGLTNAVSDMLTVVSEQILGMMLSEEGVTDEAWNSYLDRMNTMGLEEALAVYQNAYEEYMRGERYNISVAGPAGGPGGGGGQPPAGEGGAAEPAPAA